MAASDNAAAAAADLRRLASINEADLEEALAYMGRGPFRRLRRAVGRTATPSPSQNEGAQGSSSPYRLDPAVNAENQVTASSEANVNNLDPALGESFLAAVSSPTASMATQDPVWPPASGGPTSLESYLGEQPEDTGAAAGGTISSSAPTTLAADDAQPEWARAPRPFAQEQAELAGKGQKAFALRAEGVKGQSKGLAIPPPLQADPYAVRPHNPLRRPDRLEHDSRRGRSRPSL